VTSILAAVVVGYLGARLTWLAARPLFGLPALVRHNYRGRLLPTAAGIVLPLAAVLVEGGRAVAGSFGVGDGPGISTVRSLVLLAALGFGVLGLVYCRRRRDAIRRNPASSPVETSRFGAAG